MTTNDYRYEARCGNCGEAVPFEGPTPEELVRQTIETGGEIHFSVTADPCPECGATLSVEAIQAATKGPAEELFGSLKADVSELREKLDRRTRQSR